VRFPAWLPICLVLGLTSVGTRAAPPDLPRARVQEESTPILGRPRILLDQVELPVTTPNAARTRKRLLVTLRREARRADWGAGRGSSIALRFFVTELAVSQGTDVTRVRCTAVGRLPKGKLARGSLQYSGDVRERDQVVERTLEIVARGVIARLAELERRRRRVLATR
jgi:hypothetical protein